MIPENDVELISIEIDHLEDGKIDYGKPKSLVSSPNWLEFISHL